MVSKYEKYYESYKTPRGAGDARPTAQQIIEDEGLVGQWKGKVVMITGASSGIGIETARALATTGAELFLPVRSPDKTKEALNDLIESGKATLMDLELSSLYSVRKCAEAFLARKQKLNLLICNAGLMSCPEGRTEDGFETQFGVNHLAHFLLFNLLKDALIAGSTPDFNSRVIMLSSSAHRFGSVNFKNLTFEGEYDPHKAYAQSKTANLWMANHIDRLFGDKGVHAWSVNPSVVQTGLGRFLDDAQVQAAFADEKTAKEARSIPQGAAPTIYAAVAKELEGKGGKYTENCNIVGPQINSGIYDEGYAPWAYDEASEKELWQVSLKMVGLE
ncbi:unnamed protein product [Clonostachys byssicola]|uniref:Uncharacterized protein n=1 Tax=Clonostachys byssicola TaxID=160290 RepID=A0A9N9UBG9_9HYPO|nr:unnamed protein product [Clonostachys byssicola]